MKWICTIDERKLTTEAQSNNHENFDISDLEETMYLISIPGMYESILKGMNTPIEECSNKLEW